MKTFLAKSLIFFSVFFISLYTFAQVQIDSVVVINESCSGNCDGTLTIYTSGGTAPVLFDIGGTPQTSNVFIGLCATTYNVTVNDALPSSDFTTATITSPSPLTFTISTNSASAYGICDGTANVTINGGTPPYVITYYAPNGTTILQTGTTTSIDSLCAATYYVQVTDANSCPPNGSGSPGLTAFAITQPAPPPLVVTQSFLAFDCIGCSNSSTLNASGGIPPYIYSWGSPSKTGICLGSFVPAWTVTDAIGQQQSGNSVMIPIPQPSISVIINNHETCAGACDGKVTLSSTSTPPIEYSKDNGATWQSSPIFTNLCPGNYPFAIRNMYHCGNAVSRTILPKTNLTYTLATNNCSVNGVCDGTANVTISGGTPPYNITYYAANGTTILQTGTSTSFTGLCAGTYYVKVTDMNNCSSTGPSGTGLNMFTISQPPPDLIVNQSINNPTCSFMCDGGSQLNVSGGVPPYTYSWGSWDLGGFCDWDIIPAWTVTDDIGQQVSGSSQMLFVSLPQITPVVNANESCIGECDGVVQGINPFGDYPPFTYAINGGLGQSSPIFGNLCPGTYNLVIINSYGCTNGYPFTINAASPIIVSIDTIIDVTCIGGCNGSATLNVTGGTPPYSYLWNDSFAQTTPTVSGLCAGTYTCNVTDDNGCDTTFNIVINEPLGDTLTATWNTTPVSCFGACDGSAMVTPNGGVPPYTFQWDDPCLTTTDSSACASCQGVYNCIVTDSNGCSITVTGITVSGPSPLIATAIVVSNPTSIGACDGVANGNVTGGSSPYTYLWVGCPPTISPNITTPIANGLCDGEYQFIVTDMNGCIDSSDCITILDPPSSINENTNNSINNIYPNPTGGLITIEFSDKVVLPLTIEIIDVKGKMVKDYYLTNKNSIIDLTSLPKGVYVLSNAKLSIHKTIILE